MRDAVVIGAVLSGLVVLILYVQHVRLEAARERRALAERLEEVAEGKSRDLAHELIAQSTAQPIPIQRQQRKRRQRDGHLKVIKGGMGGIAVATAAGMREHPLAGTALVTGAAGALLWATQPFASDETGTPPVARPPATSPHVPRGPEPLPLEALPPRRPEPPAPTAPEPADVEAGPEESAGQGEQAAAVSGATAEEPPPDTRPPKREEPPADEPPAESPPAEPCTVDIEVEDVARARVCLPRVDADALGVEATRRSGRPNTDPLHDQLDQRASSL